MTHHEFEKIFLGGRLGDDCIIALAGRAGEFRANRGLLVPWHPFPHSKEYLIRIHEASHAVLAWVAGDHVHLLSVEPRRDLKMKDNGYIAGRVKHSRDPEPCPDHPDRLYPSDEQIVQNHLELARDYFGVDEAYVPALRARLAEETERLVDKWWGQIMALAERLGLDDNLSEREVLELLGPAPRRWPQAPSETEIAADSAA